MQIKVMRNRGTYQQNIIIGTLRTMNVPNIKIINCLLFTAIVVPVQNWSIYTIVHIHWIIFLMIFFLTWTEKALTFYNFSFYSVRRECCIIISKYQSNHKNCDLKVNYNFQFPPYYKEAEI